MNKKLLALVLAFSMMLSMAMPAMAADTGNGEEIVTDSGDNTWNPGDGAEGEVAVPKLVMSVPTFDATTLKFDVYNQLNGAQIVSKDLSFTNWSTVPVEITLQKYSAYTSSGTPIVGMTSSNAVQAGNARNLFLWFNEAERDTSGNLIDGDAKDGFQPKYPAVTTVDVDAVAARAIGEYEINTPANPTQVAVTGDPAPFAQIEAGATPDPELDGDPVFKTLDEVGTTNKLTLKFDGSINTKATWGATEKITVVPIFSIEKIAITPTVDVSTTTTLTIGESAAGIVIKGSGFKPVGSATAVTGLIDVSVGTTDLTVGTFTATEDTITIGLTGTILKGTLTVQPLIGAFDGGTMDGKKLVIRATNTKPTMSVAAAPSATALGRASGTSITLTMPKANEVVKATLSGTDFDITVPGKTVTVTSATASATGITLTGVTCTGAAAGDVLTIALKPSAANASGDYPLPDAVTTTAV